MFDKEVDRCNIHELPSGELLCCCRAIHERYSRAASHACLDGRDALELDDSREVRHGEIARRQVLFENLARARSRLAQDEALAKKVANGAGPGNVGSKLCGGGAPLGICRVVDLGFSSRPVRDASSCPGSDDPFCAGPSGDGDIRLAREDLVVKALAVE